MYHINGCTDKDAINYDCKANRDDGSCRYYVYGCMDEIANNYNDKAEKDDGSCKYNSNLSNKNNNVK